MCVVQMSKNRTFVKTYAASTLLKDCIIVIGYISCCCHYGTKKTTKLTTVIKEYAIGSNCTINNKKLFQKRGKELKIKKYYSLVAVLPAFFFIFSFNFIVYHSETVQSIFKITILLRFVRKFVLFLKTILISALL